MLISFSNHPLTDNDLVEFVRWPSGLSAEEIRRRIALAERFIDFDYTLIDWSTSLPTLRRTFCGQPLRDFLAEKPFLVQTWNSTKMPMYLFDPPERDAYNEPGWDWHEISHLFLTPRLPEPLLIIRPPQIWRKRKANEPLHEDDDENGLRFCKDLHAFGISCGEVYDDESFRVYAPGCKLISDFDERP